MGSYTQGCWPGSFTLDSSVFQLLNFLAGRFSSNIRSISLTPRPFISGIRYQLMSAPAKHDPTYVNPTFPRRFPASGLKIYGKAMPVVAEVKADTIHPRPCVLARSWRAEVSAATAKEAGQTARPQTMIVSIIDTAVHLFMC